MSHLCRHILAEFYKCSSPILDSVKDIKECMELAAIKCGATIVQSVFHKFAPQGVSGVVVIAESHLAIHSWPNYNYASVDVYSCGDLVDPIIAIDVLKECFCPNTVIIKDVIRGEMEYL